jgi:phosphocarrier protein FPr/phosphocarrier protein
MLVAAGEVLLDVADGALVILDATGGWIDIVPDQQRIVAAREGVRAPAPATRGRCRGGGEECRMADGTRIEIFANLASAEEAGRAWSPAPKAAGCCAPNSSFMIASAAPTEDEQASAYAAVARALGGRPLIVRTLDAGGDKPLSLSCAPARGQSRARPARVRLSLSRPDLLATQLRAILRAAPEGDIRIMVPMVVDVAELRAVRMALDRSRPTLPSTLRRLASWSRPRPRPCLPAASPPRPTSCRSAPTISANMPSLPTAAIPPRRPDRRASSGRAAADRRGRGGAAQARQMVRHLRRNRLRSARLGDPDRSRRHRIVGDAAAIPALKANVRGLRLEACKALAAAALEADTAEAVRSSPSGRFRRK